MIRFNLFQVSRRRLLIFLSTALAFALGIWLVNTYIPNQSFWRQFDTESDIAQFFCEKTFMDHIVRQPINTFSNFIYWLSAIIILNRGLKDRTKKTRYNIISANPFYSITLGVILLYIFSASVFFHSSLIRFAGELDFSAVYSLSLFPLMYFTHRVWLLRIGVPSNRKHPFSTRILIIIFSIAYLLLTFGLPSHGALRNYVVLGIIILLLLFAVIVETQDRGKTNHYYLITCSVSILFAVMWFAFDVHKVFCNPDSVIQPHSLWHLFSGISAFYFYMYIRSEKNKI